MKREQAPAEDRLCATAAREVRKARANPRADARAIANTLLSLAAIALAAGLLFSSAACSSLPRSSLSQRSDPAKRIETYGFDPSVRFVDRMRSAPEELLAYLRAMDSNPRYSSREASLEEKTLLTEYYAELPVSFKEVMEEKVAGVFIVEDFAGGGMSDFIFGADGTMYAVLVLNSRVFELSLQDWIEYRDESTFSEGGAKTRNGLGSAYKGFLHTLVHESCHVYDYFARVTPGVEKGAPKAEVDRGEQTQFTSGIWRAYGTPAPAYDFAHRDKLTAYGLGPRLDAELAAGVYRALAATPFSSLYGSWNWAEDFAETFAWYHIEKIYGLEYWVEISRGGEILFRFKPSRSPAVRARYALFEKLMR
jgi:hypothetical protein